jgi:DNA-binding transcriptional regulator GbsR (MarR family)
MPAETLETGPIHGKRWTAGQPLRTVRKKSPSREESFAPRLDRLPGYDTVISVTTEITARSLAVIDLTPAMQKFILHWGEMGSRWGINRTVAQVHALLYLADRPLNAEEITDTLGVARSNISTSLRELQGWNIVRIVHVMGDRRDHFETLGDVWEMFQIILDERKRREIDPTMRLLRECIGEIDELRQQTTQDKQTRQRLQAMLEFFESMSGWYAQVRRLPQSALRKLVQAGGKVNRLLGSGRRSGEKSATQSKR